MWRTWLLFLVVSANLTHAAVLVNGDFEVPVVPNTTWGFTYVAPQYHLNDPPPEFGWHIGNIDIDLIRVWQASHGGQSIDLNGYNRGAIYQDFYFPGPGTWRVQFDMAANPDAPGLKPFELDFGTPDHLTTLGSYAPDSAGRNHDQMNYSSVSSPDIVITDATVLYRVQFASLLDGNAGAVLDNIRIVQVPEPMFCSLFAAAVGLFTLARFRPRNA